LVRPIPRRLRHKAFRAVLADKLREGKVVVVETTQTAGVKTRDVVHWLARIGAKDRPLIVLGGRNDEVARASRNIKGATAVPRTELNALTLMMHGAVVISRDDFRAMQEQLT
jgi:large subunit ribosomal protein L4